MATVGQRVWDTIESDDGDTLELVIRTAVPLGSALRRTVAALAVEGGRAAEQGAPDYSANVAPTVDGPVVHVDTWELEQRLPVIASELDRAGLPDAAIDVHASAGPALMLAPRPVGFLETRLAVRGARVAPRPGAAQGHWTITDATLAAAADLAVRWCGSLPGARWYVDAGLTSSAVPADRAAEILALTVRTAAADTGARDPVRLITQAGTSFRMVVLSPATAHVSFVAGDVERLDWRTAYAAVLAPVPDAAPWAVRGFVKRGGHWDYAGPQTLTNDWAPAERPPGSGGLQERDREESGLPDVFGTMILPAGDAPPGWSVAPAGDLFIVTHPEPNAWYAAERPDPAILATARTAAGPWVSSPG